MNQKLSYLVILFPLCTFAAKQQFLLFLSYISRAGSSVNTRCQEQVVLSYTQAPGQAQGAPSAHCNSIALSLSKSPACFSREGKKWRTRDGKRKDEARSFLFCTPLCCWSVVRRHPWKLRAPIAQMDTHSEYQQPHDS